MKLNAVLLAVTTLLLFSFNLQAQEFNRAKLDDFFNRIETNNKGMGSFSIFENGKEVYQKTIGYADIDKKQKANTKTKYRVGSISKTFTAVIILQLIEEGKLRFDTKLNQFYPSVPNADNITIRQLLRHRSGIHNFTNAKDYTEWMEQAISKKDLVKKISSHDPAFEPDQKAGYSNSNYVLLAFITEDIEKKFFDKIFEERIIRKCQLKNTTIGGKINTDKNEALSYSMLGDWQTATETDMSVPIGAGSVISTPTDLNIFFHKLFNENVISKTHLDSMIDMQDKYGMGIFEYPYHDDKLYGHTGGIDGFQSQSAYMPSKKITVSYIANGVAWPRNNIIKGAMKIYFGEEYELPDFAASYSPTEAELKSQTGIYSTPSFPLKLTITSKNGKLLAQGTGQPQFALEAVAKNKYKFDAAGLKITFKPDDNSLLLKQGGMEFTLKKE